MHLFRHYSIRSAPDDAPSAINGGNAGLDEAFGITTDQRGAPRFPPGGDGMVDIGAYEVAATFASVVTDGPFSETKERARQARR